MASEKYKLSYDDLDYSIPEENIKKPESGWASVIIGQPRAIEALSLGTAIRVKGYNIFVTGSPGTGRRTAVTGTLSKINNQNITLCDCVYVYNFANPQNPKALYFKAGQANKFKKDIHNFVENIKKLITLYTNSADTKKRHSDLENEHSDAENKQLAAFEAELAQQGFRVVQIEGDDNQTTTDIAPIFNGEAISFADLEKQIGTEELSKEKFASLRENYFVYMDKMRKLFVELKKSRTELEEKLNKLEIKSLYPLIASEIDILKKQYTNENTILWLDSLKADVIDKLYLFKQNLEKPDEQKSTKNSFIRYGVNILTDNTNANKPPIIFEANPSYQNIFGGLETRQAKNGEVRTNYLSIRAGSIIKSAGGFLIMQAEDLINDEVAWTAVKRVLSTGKIEIQPQVGPMGIVSTMKPEPLELDIKVVLIGGEGTYDLLYNADPDFQKLFKICAEFDSSMEKNNESISEYVAFVQKITLEEGLLEASSDGLSAIIEYGIRLSGRKNRISTQFSKIADLVREADYQAAKNGKNYIDKESVTKADNLRSWMASMPEEKTQEMIVNGDIILEAKGSRVGRVNGLAVYDRGYYSFGVPAVISAQVSPGESGVINIEGESGLSGEIYDKAVLIVEGFLRSRYAKQFPLAVSASICFEQSYTSVEGDSASSTAVYALLSTIANIPLRQDIAVTGSVNQMGQIQPVGGVSEKVEGFYRICKKAGLSGSQGVMIPKQNVNNLLLSCEVMQAIKDGKFSIYSVGTIDEGIEVLSGKEPGFQDNNGIFPKDSFNGIVFEKLKEMAETVKQYKD